MSALYENELPEAVKYDGKIYKFHTDFREWIRFEELLLDKDIPERNKSAIMRRLIFPTAPPVDVTEFMMWFYRCGKEQRNIKSQKKQARCYSFEYDDDLIFAAFYQVYKIDLSAVGYMHWWKFHALFSGLPEGTKIGAVMGYRTTDTDSKTMGAERAKRYKELKAYYRLPRYICEQQQIDMAKKMLEENRHTR